MHQLQSNHQSPPKTIYKVKRRPDSQKMSVDGYTRTDNNDSLLHGYENADEVIRIPSLDLERPLQAL